MSIASKDGPKPSFGMFSPMDTFMNYEALSVALFSKFSEKKVQVLIKGDVCKHILLMI